MVVAEKEEKKVNVRNVRPVAPVAPDPKAQKDQLMDMVMKQLEDTLKNVPPEQLAAAKKEAEKLLEGDLSWTDMSQYTPEKIYQIAETGYERFKMGQYDSAEKIFRGLTVLEPENYYYHQMLGAIFQRKEKWAEALVEYSIAIDMNPKDMVSLTNRGEVYIKIGIMEFAEKDLNTAVAMDPKNEDRWANRARMLQEQIKIARERKQDKK